MCLCCWCFIWVVWMSEGCNFCCVIFSCCQRVFLCTDGLNNTHKLTASHQLINTHGSSVHKHLCVFLHYRPDTFNFHNQSLFLFSSPSSNFLIPSWNNRPTTALGVIAQTHKDTHTPFQITQHVSVDVSDADVSVDSSLVLYVTVNVWKRRMRNVMLGVFIQHNKVQCQ